MLFLLTAILIELSASFVVILFAVLILPPILTLYRWVYVVIGRLIPTPISIRSMLMRAIYLSRRIAGLPGSRWMLSTITFWRATGRPTATLRLMNTPNWLESLQSRHDLLPHGLQRFLELIKAENTLLRNLERSHIELTLERISLRRKSLAPLATAAVPMWQQEAALKVAFDSFFPQLVSYTREYQKKLNAGIQSGR